MLRFFHQHHGGILPMVTALWLLLQLLSSSRSIFGGIPTAAASSSPNDNLIITDLILVDVATQRDLLVLQNHSVLDTSVYGTQLTVRAAVSSTSGAGVDENAAMVEWNLDHGKTRRIEPAAPYLLAGKSSAGPQTTLTEFYASNLLVQPGTHTLTARVTASAVLGEERGRRRHLQQQMIYEEGVYAITFTTVQDGGDSDEVGADAFGEEGGQDLADATPPSILQTGIPASAQGTVTISSSNSTPTVVTIGFLGPITSGTLLLFCRSLLRRQVRISSKPQTPQAEHTTTHTAAVLPCTPAHRSALHYAICISHTMAYFL